MSGKASFLKRLIPTSAYQRVLRQQTIAETEPGTVLRDFEAVLGFVGPAGVEVSSTYHLFSKKSLPQVNAGLSRPLQIGLQRPQQKSYPHVNGLYLLLRAAGLSWVDEAGDKPRLILDEAALQAWRGLNPTERYFTLLEAWLLRGHPEIVGEERGGYDPPIEGWASFFRRVPDQGLPVAGDKEIESDLSFSPGLHAIALLELFGLIAVQDAPPEAGKGWRIARVRRTRLGDALLELLFEPLCAPQYRQLYRHPQDVVLGELRPLVAPFFPAWQNNLALPAPEFRDGLYIFKVSLGKAWRRIAVPGGLTMDRLGGSILDAFDFDHDHLYRFGWMAHINHPYLEEAPFTADVRVGDLPLRPGGRMGFLYDFGDSWEFDVRLERVDPADSERTRPAVIERHGKSVKQYPG